MNDPLAFVMQTVKLPLRIALRIVKKRGWRLAKTEPVMSRWQHFKRSVMWRVQ